MISQSLFPVYKSPGFPSQLQVCEEKKRQRCTPTLLEKFSDDANAQLYVTKFSTISLYLTKLATQRQRSYTAQSPNTLLTVYSIYCTHPRPNPIPHFFLYRGSCGQDRSDITAEKQLYLSTITRADAGGTAKNIGFFSSCK